MATAPGPGSKCTCGHTDRWHGQKSGDPQGTGQCEFTSQCGCKKFVEETAKSPEPKLDYPGCGGYLSIAGEKFDLRLDFFICPKHGIITPLKFAPGWWTTDEGCPVPVSDDERCREGITPVLLDVIHTLADAMKNISTAVVAWREDEPFRADESDRWYEADAEFLDYIDEICKGVHGG